MPFRPTRDTEFGDCFFNISKAIERLVRAALKTYERTGTYFFLKVVTKTTNDYGFEQRILLTLGVFENLVSTASKKQNSATDQQSSTKPSIAKKSKTKTKLSTSMVEAMFESCPNYFKQFQKQFKFLIVEEKPCFYI